MTEPTCWVCEKPLGADADWLYVDPGDEKPVHRERCRFRMWPDREDAELRAFLG